MRSIKKGLLLLFSALAVLTFVAMNNGEWRFAVEPVFVASERFGGNWSDCHCKNRGRVWITRNDRGNFERHRQMARQHGPGPFSERADIRRAVDLGLLVRLPTRGTGYRIASEQFQHSEPYFTPHARDAFVAFAARFAEAVAEREGIKNARLVVSSGTRSEADQQKVRQTAAGATPGISPHSFGAALDIKDIEIPEKLGARDCDRIRGILEELLREQDNVLWVLERACLHLTFPAGE